MEGNLVIGGDVGLNSNDYDDRNVNPETVFSYMDEKIQNVLGRFQKDFEGAVSIDNLGSKYGVYGSFLLSEEESPSRESIEEKGIQNSLKKYTAKSFNIGAASYECSAIRKPATDLLPSVKNACIKLSPQLHTTPAEMKSDVHDGTTIPLTTNSEHRSLKLRIKVGSYGKITTPTINRGVDLIKSSYSSVGQGFEGNERTFQESNAVSNESPATILQVMVSFPVKDALLSPLPESVLCFGGKEICNNDRLESNRRRKLPLNKTSLTLKKRKLSSMEGTTLRKSSLQTNNKSNSDVNIEKFALVKDSGSGVPRKIERLSQNEVNENRMVERADSVQNNLKRPDVSHGNNEHGDTERAVSSRKDDREFSKLKSSCVFDKRHANSRKLMSKKNLLAERNDNRAKKMRLESLPKDSCNVSNSLEDAKENHNRNSSVSVDDEPIFREPKATTRKRKYLPVSTSEIDKRKPFTTMPKKQAMKNVTKAKNSFKSLTEISRFSKGSEQSDISEMDLNSSALSSHKEKKEFNDKETPDLCRQNIPDSERSLIEDEWVMCDSCEKWRLLPHAIKPENLPEKWLCNMLDWLPGMNSCDISEEETTKALCARNQISPDVVLTYYQDYKDTGRANASTIKENKGIYFEKTQASTKSSTRDCLKTTSFVGVPRPSKSAMISAQVPTIRKDNHGSKQIAQNVPPSFSDAETRAEKHIGDGSFDDGIVRRKPKKPVLHGISEASRAAKAKGFGRTASVDSSSQKKSLFLPDCSTNELDDSKRRLLLSIKVRENKAPDAKPADLRNLDTKTSEIKPRGLSNIRETHAVCEKETVKSKFAPKSNSNGACNAAEKKKSASINDRSNSYEFHENDNMIPDKGRKVSTDEMLHCPSNFTREERLNGRINDRKSRTKSDVNKLNNLQVCGNNDSKKADYPSESDKQKGLQVEPSDRTPSSTQAASEILKEAQILRDRGDRFRDSGFTFEGNETYFEAALKFLHGAYLLDSSTSEAPKNGDIAQYQAYSTAAQLFKCCSKEYEKKNDMATSALAYKCTEVANWNMVYWRNPTSVRDRTELQSNLKLIPGHSPSSSASDVDNLNNPNSRGRKGSVTMIPTANSAHILRLLDYTRDADAAVESSKRARSSFAAAERGKKKEWVASVRNVLNFSFQGVDRFVQMVRAAAKEVNRSSLRADQ